MTYRPDIDGLRALAVLSVVLCHAGLGFPGGYVGVDVFFVISGYLIAGLMLKEIDAGTFSLAHFWERRIRRILPPLFVVVAASFVAGWFVLVPTAYHTFGRGVINLVLMQSNTFHGNLTDYFAPASDELPLLHTWSLAVEEQFYLFVPLAFWAVARFRRSWLGPIVVAAASLSFGACVYGLRSCDPHTYFALATRAWELLLGVLIAVRRPTASSASSHVRNLAAYAALACIFGPCFFYGPTTPFPGWTALVPVVGTMLLIVLGGVSANPTVVHRMLSSAAARNIGLVSYSLYLWHWPVIVFYKYRFITPPSLPERCLLVVGSVALAIVTYRYVEQPFRCRDLLPSRPQVFAAAFASVLILLIGAQTLKWSGGAAERLPLQARLPLIDCINEYDPNRAPLPGTKETLVVLGGTETATPELLVWGDSHAMTLFPLLDDLCRTTNVAARCAYECGRPPLVDHPTADSKRKRDQAQQSAAAVIEYVRTERIPNVLLAARWEFYARHADFNDTLTKTIDALEAAGSRVYFLKSIPTYPFDVRAAMMRHIWHGHDPANLAMTVEEHEVRHDYEKALVERLSGRGISIVDPVPALSTRSGGAKRLIPFNADGLFYRDADHLNRHGAMVLRPTFTPLIARLAGEQIARRDQTPGRASQIESTAGRPMSTTHR